MKKILIATSALAFASSAFAADVSGYAITAYKKNTYNGVDTTSLYSEAEAYLSGSKTLSNGLTFGATYTLGLEDSSTSQTTEGSGTADAQDPELEVFEGEAIGTQGEAGYVPARVAKPAVVAVKAGDDYDRSDYSNINAHVSGSFGKVEMGHHASATKALGTASIASGETISSSWTGDATNITVDNALTYTTPAVYGLQAAFTMVPENEDDSYMAVKYVGNAAGIGYAVSAGKSATTVKYEGDFVFDTMSYGFEVNKSGFSLSYSTATTDATGENTVVGTVAENSDDVAANLFPEMTKSRLGLAYANKKWSVGFGSAEIEDMATAEKVNLTDMYVGYDLVPSLTVFVEKVSSGDDDIMLIGTNITF